MSELLRSARMLMRMALSLLDNAGEQNAVLYLQQAIDILREEHQHD